jgi:hypothetical protein
MTQFNDYFESEAARPAVSPTDNAYAVAVSRICEDGGKAWNALKADA